MVKWEWMESKYRKYGDGANILFLYHLTPSAYQIWTRSEQYFRWSTWTKNILDMTRSWSHLQQRPRAPSPPSKHSKDESKTNKCALLVVLVRTVLAIFSSQTPWCPGRFSVECWQPNTRSSGWTFVFEIARLWTRCSRIRHWLGCIKTSFS